MHSSSNESVVATKVNHGRRFTSRALTSPAFLVTLGTTLLIATVVVGQADSFVMGSRPLSKRSFFDIQCKGVYDKGIFAKLDRICDDCYNLYREPQLHSLCRSNCFGSPYFKGCLDALLLNEEDGKFDEMIEILGKKKK
ncbi:ion transport peptide isoform X2 [Folsomia candida]|uniref:Ion transport peptide n=1 Tax=Folsomia candida TaxID=158441 RepID=B5LAP6_FOLCA|nr:ion transport peptide isoform X2 [Folsomia candida]ACF15252.1 prepro-ion transport peptide [Folsomia candida]OXA42830.1 Ion transport peptide [Folsomia candida]